MSEMVERSCGRDEASGRPRPPADGHPVVAPAVAAGLRRFVTGDCGLCAALPGVGLRALAPDDRVAQHVAGERPWG